MDGKKLMITFELITIIMRLENLGHQYSQEMNTPIYEMRMFYDIDNPLLTIRE